MDPLGHGRQWSSAAPSITYWTSLLGSCCNSWMDFQRALTKTGLFACRGRDDDQKLNDMAACQKQLVDADSNVLSIQPL